MIFDQQFAEGTQLRKGQSVGVSVSIGKGVGDIEVPDFIGKSLSEATKNSYRQFVDCWKDQLPIFKFIITQYNFRSISRNRK